MDRRVMERLEEQLCEVAKSYAESGLKSPEDVATIKHVLSGMLKIKCLEEMENFKGGYSRRGRSYDGDYSHDGGTFSHDNRSYRRDSMGRYADGRSGDMKQEIEQLMRHANEQERHVLEDMMNRM